MSSAHTEFAEVLRAWRDRVPPAAAGLPVGGERRVPGLRREELAALAGVSVDYLVRLEQGRATSPSPQVLASLARALRLTTDERDLLYRMAGVAPPDAGLVPRHVPPGVQRMLDRLSDSAVGVFTTTWELLQWNPLWAALLGDPSKPSGRERNIAWRWFTTGRSRVRHADGELERFEHEMVGELRLASARYPRDTDLTALIGELLAASPRFAELWERFDLVTRVSARKTVEHPVVGSITLDCDVLTAPDADIRIVVYTAEPGSADAASLELVRVTGLQQLTADSIDAHLGNQVR
jgi:transcriptional regulator with XRE-family HTH domain